MGIPVFATFSSRSFEKAAAASLVCFSFVPEKRT
jgi:hypothetical protein